MTDPSVSPKATLTEVAALAGVSLATASKVANGRPDVARKTRERVEQAIRDLRYETLKRNPSTARPSIAFLADVFGSTYAMEILRGAVEAAEEAGVDLVLERIHATTEPAGQPTTAALTQRLLAANRLGAVVLTSGIGGNLYSSIVSARLPMVVIDPLDSSLPGVVSVGSTNWLGGRSAAEHLLGLGHREVAVLAGPLESLSATARLDGFLSTFRQAGISIPEDRVRHVRFDAGQAAATSAQWLESPSPPTAILAASDTQAMGVLRVADRMGVQIPEQLSVVSYDDTPLASWATPPLTAVHQPLADMGRRAVETALLMHAGGEPESRHIELATSLVVRDSTAAPAAGA